MIEPELWSERFAQYLEVRGYARQTVESYLAELKPFFGFLEEQAVESLGTVTRAHLEDYRARLFYQRTPRGRHLSASTQHLRLGALKAFFRFLARLGFVLVDAAAGLELPRKASGLPTVLTESEVLRLLDVPDFSTLLGIRDRTILEVLYGTGVRNSELCALTVDACDLAVPALRILEGKGGKSRVVPLGGEALAWLEAYLGQVWPRLQPVSRRPQQVFLSRSGQPFDRHDLTGLVRRLSARAELTKRVTPHVLRHSMATHMLRRGANLRHLQALLGHASAETTAHYTRVEVSDLKRVVQRCHPRERGGRPPA